MFLKQPFIEGRQRALLELVYLAFLWSSHRSREIIETFERVPLKETKNNTVQFYRSMALATPPKLMASDIGDDFSRFLSSFLSNLSQQVCPIVKIWQIFDGELTLSLYLTCNCQQTTISAQHFQTIVMTEHCCDLYSQKICKKKLFLYKNNNENFLSTKKYTYIHMYGCINGYTYICTYKRT